MVSVNLSIIKRFSEETNRVQVYAILKCDDEEYLRNVMSYHDKPTIAGEQYLYEFLQKIFKDHAEFYQSLGFEYDINKHHSDHNDFRKACDGFENFMKEYYNALRWEKVSEQALQEIANISTTKIRELIQKYEQARDTHVNVSTTVSFAVLGKTEQVKGLDKIDFKITDDVLLLTGDKVYKVTLRRAEGVKSLNDIANTVANSIHSAYEVQLKSKVAVLENRVKELQEEVEQAKQRFLREGIKLALSELQFWRIDGDYAVYSKTIYVTHIQKNGKLYNLPEQLKHFYIKGLKVKIRESISKAYCDKAYHANTRATEVCIGSLAGSDFITVLKKLPETLRIMNLDSAYDNDAKEEAENILHDLHEKAEVTTWTS